MDSKSLEKKLSSVKESSEDIQSLSRWCIQHRSHHHSIVQAWSRAIRKAKVGQRLTLFYVCNEVVQNAKRKKCPELVQFFGTAVKEAAPLVREDKIRRKIIRIFNIWEERGIYDSGLVSEFTNIVEKVGTVNSTENDIVLSSFQLPHLVESVTNLITQERSSHSLLADLKTQEHMFTEEEIKLLRVTVKERGGSRERLEEFEDSVASLEFYIDSLQNEIDERTKSVTLLEQAEIFYETQRGEAKLVATAYKNFNSQVKFLKKKLLEKLPNLPEELSPLPTPPLDAPSPQSESEDIIVEGNHQNNEGHNSFMDPEPMPSFVKTSKNSMHSDSYSSSFDSPFTEAEKRDSTKSPNLFLSKERKLEEEQQEFELQIANFSNNKKSYMDAKPMNAKELLDTFGKSVSKPSLAAPIDPPSFHIPTSMPPIPPLPPDPPMMSSIMQSGSVLPPIPSPNYPLHSALPIPLPPSAPPPVPPSIPLPRAFPPPLPPPPTHLQFPPPLPKAGSYQSFGKAANRDPWSDSWKMRLPPPPPPPPMEVQSPLKMLPEPNWRGPFSTDDWNAYEPTEEPPEDDDSDDVNWGEPPGTEELQTFEQLQAAADEGKSSFMIPPPPPPPQFSSLARSEDIIKSPNRNINLVNIESSERDSDEFRYDCYDDHNSSEQLSFVNDDLFNTDDTDMRRLESSGRSNVEESGSDMDISEGEGSDYDRPRRHRKDHSDKQEESPHKPVSFSLTKGSKPLIPLSDKTSGFNQDDDNYKKRLLPMPPSYHKRQRIDERNAESEAPKNVTGSNFTVLPQPLLDDINTNIIAKALDNVRKIEAIPEEEQHKGPSLSEALGMYYDSDNESDVESHTEPHTNELPSTNDDKQSSENNSPIDISSFQDVVTDVTETKPIETVNESSTESFSQVIESFISDSRANEGGKEEFSEVAEVAQPLQEDGQKYFVGENVTSVKADQSYEPEPPQAITAMHSYQHSAPPSGVTRPWYDQRNQRGFYGNRPTRPHRGYQPRAPFHRGRGGFRGRPPFNSPMGPRWRPRGGRQSWW